MKYILKGIYVINNEAYAFKTLIESSKSKRDIELGCASISQSKEAKTRGIRIVGECIPVIECPCCNKCIDKTDKYCRFCGQAIQRQIKSVIQSKHKY